MSPEEVAFESGVFLLLKAKAKGLYERPEPKPEPTPETRAIRLSGIIPPELWNRLGTKVIPKLRSVKDLNIQVQFLGEVDSALSGNLESELCQLLEDLSLADKMKVD